MFDFDDPKNWSVLIIGILLMALGLIPLLHGWGVIGFGLPKFLANIISSIGLYLIAAGGIYLLIDSFMEDSTMRIVSIIVAVTVTAFGIFALLFQFGVLPWNVSFLASTVPMIYNIVFVIEGLFLFIAAFAMF
ncbi:hypothetical protein GOV08_02265 [Candidatus Woesearchaeota archaeon]|nr:hypothetical protein [Candidatus Woesearchaeota archaeon]